MADHRTAGAAAPIPSAALAASPTATAPAPHELLQQLAGWMSASGHDADHPWQVAIAGTLAAHAPQDSGHAAALFNDLAFEAHSLSQMLLRVLGGDDELIGPAYTVVCRIGWTCDVTSKAMGGLTHRGDAEDWFMSPAAASALSAVRNAAASQKGASIGGRNDASATIGAMGGLEQGELHDPALCQQLGRAWGDPSDHGGGASANAGVTGPARRGRRLAAGAVRAAAVKGAA